MTFSQKLAAAFVAVALLSAFIAGFAAYQMNHVVEVKDDLINHRAERLLEAERLRTLSMQKGLEARAYFMTRDPARAEAVRQSRTQLRALIDGLRRTSRTDEGRRMVDELARVEATHGDAVDALLPLTARGTSLEELSIRVEREVRPHREQLDRLIDGFVQREERLLAQGRADSSESARAAIRVVLVLAALGVIAAVILSVGFARTLSRQISMAVRHVQTSSTELQAAAGEQATGAKEQATAMAEITTTITELLATSRQIAESAQRVVAIATETGGAARTGDQTVQRSQESIGTIRRQVELIVNHMLDLGRKSQQIGGILEIINELSEQTNILAINATIEAAGAGEAGRRFAVVAEEIRKLADRVGGSTKDIRVLIEEVRSAVNTTVMATESGSKAVEAGARQFSEVAASFAHIARLVGTTTDAAREIELSTKQQSTAVEQVNLAITNVAQATREAEASSGQTLQTASQLAGMSRDLSRLVQSKAAA
ncbi:MAG TPA: methyl-accepting chemotaxis protein [Anaeromyxobacteraceae bacterium]|nr:methyl-accepting chemotaxis protein [Anaeromyxobacteraceae bacterium]